MTRFLLALSLLAAATAALAEPHANTPGYTLSLYQDRNARAGAPLAVTVAVTRTVGLTAQLVAVEWTLPEARLLSIDERCAQTHGLTYRCEIGEIEPGTTDTLEAKVVAPGLPLGPPTSARLVSALPAPAEPLAVDLRLTARTDADLDLTVDVREESNTIDVTVETRTAGADTISLRFLTQFLELDVAQAPQGWTCRFSDGLVCDIAPFAARDKQTLRLNVRPSFSKGEGPFHAFLTWKKNGFPDEELRSVSTAFILFHEFDVTSGADAGPGSLRQAIEDANAICTHRSQPCRIRFADGVVARPETPLPTLEAHWITLERARIDGSALRGPATGLQLRAARRAEILGLTIESVPGNALVLHEGSYAIGGSTIRNNGGRGITAVSAQFTIVSSGIHDNGASGIFVVNGRGDIAHNRIQGNGASGIFAAGFTTATIRNNFIAGNRHVAIGLGAPQDVKLDVVANEILGTIDIGLDGPSHRALTEGLHAPILTAARYDPATDTTAIDGLLDRPSFAYWLYYDVHFYADGRFLGTLEDLRKRSFRFRAPGDLRGRAITANAIREARDIFNTRETTELSNAIEVSP